MRLFWLFKLVTSEEDRNTVGNICIYIVMVVCITSAKDL